MLLILTTLLQKNSITIFAGERSKEQLDKFFVNKILEYNLFSLRNLYSDTNSKNIIYKGSEDIERITKVLAMTYLPRTKGSSIFGARAFYF